MDWTTVNTTVPDIFIDSKPTHDSVMLKPKAEGKSEFNMVGLYPDEKDTLAKFYKDMLCITDFENDIDTPEKVEFKKAMDIIKRIST